jgi:hypothetical protein
MDGIKIPITEDDLLEMSDSDKLNMLVKVALMNRQDLDAQRKILVGNGEPSKSLCGKMDSVRLQLKALWCVIISVSSFVAGILAKHIMGH